MNWNIILVYPIRDEFYDDSNEDQCVATNHSPAPPAPPPAPQHALQPIMPEQHQQHAPPPKKNIRHMTGPCSTFSWTNGHSNKDSQPAPIEP